MKFIITNFQFIGIALLTEDGQFYISTEDGQFYIKLLI